MSSYQSSPTRESNTKRALDIVRIGHDTLDDTHLDLRKAILGIDNFQSIPSDPESRKVYQYQIENQEYYLAHEAVIFTALSSFLPVVNNMKKELFKLEMQVPDDTQNMTPAMGKSSMKPSLKERLLGSVPKKRVITKDDPYQDGLIAMREIMSKIERFERFSEMQSFGVSNHQWFPYEAMVDWLDIHRTQWKFHIKPMLITVHQMNIDNIKAKEKEGAIKIVAKLDQESFQTRNDFMKPSP